MSDDNVTETPKKRTRRTQQNGASEGHTEAQDAAPVTAPEVSVPPAVPLPTIDILPEEVQNVLKSFRSQLSSAPAEIQAMVANYLFAPNSEPTGQPEKIDEPVSSAVDPVASTKPAPAMESPVVRKFEDQKIPDGFQNLPSMMIYSSFANGFAPMRALAVDVLQWGSKPVIIARCGVPVKVMSAEGEIIEIPPKMVFAIPAESDLIAFIRPLTEDQVNAYEIFFAPTCIERDDSGSQIVRYKVALGTRVPKSSVWPPK